MNGGATVNGYHGGGHEQLAEVLKRLASDDPNVRSAAVRHLRNEIHTRGAREALHGDDDDANDICERWVFWVGVLRVRAGVDGVLCLLRCVVSLALALTSIAIRAS